MSAAALRRQAQADKDAINKALRSIDVLEERVEFLNKLRDHKIFDLYYLFLVNCDDIPEIFDHYLQHVLHHIWYVLFELKLLLNGRLHGQDEESRYTEYILPGDRRGHFKNQPFVGPEGDLQCVLSELSVDGIRYGALHKVFTLKMDVYGLILILLHYTRVTAMIRHVSWVSQ